MTLSIKNNGTWVQPKSISIKDGGVWKEVKAVYVKDGASWKQTYTSVVPPSLVEFLIIAGGGGCAADGGGLSGGGGGGGVIQSTKGLEPGIAYPVTVGVGGYNQADGGNSSFLNLTAIGGGGGGGDGDYRDSPPCGSGGGVMENGFWNGADIYGGRPVVAGQGNRGGDIPRPDLQPVVSTGGGGFGSPAQDVNPDVGESTNGGNGLYSDFSGTFKWYAGGGAGYMGGSPGQGGGGATPNNGGGGSDGIVDGRGSSGVVIIRYKTDYSKAVATTGNPVYTNVNGYHIYTFNNNGSITF